MNEEDQAALIRYRLSRANHTLHEVKDHISHGYYHTAINRTYYACFYAISALLLKNGIKAQTHSGIRQMFGLHFIQTGLISRELGRSFSELFDYRHTSDYDDFIEFDKNTVEELLSKGSELIKEIVKLVE